MSAFSPVHTIGTHLIRAYRSAHPGCSRRAARKAVIGLLEEVEISNARERLHHYPHEYSGGMRQRVMIAAALVGNPQLLIADEPTTALDVTVQKQILRLIKEMQQRHGTALLFVTHDLGVVSKLCQSMTVLFSGKVLEDTSVAAFFEAPGHPYSAALLAATPKYTDPSSSLLPVPEQVIANVKAEIRAADQWRRK